MTTTYGVSSAGFYPKGVQELISEIEADLGTLVYDPTSPEGQIVGSVAEKLGEIWEILATCFNALNPDDAEGFLLDNLGAITGTPRQSPKPSYVFASYTFTSAGTYTAGSLVSFVTATPDQQWSNALDIVVTAPGTQSALTVSAEDGAVVALSGTLTGMVAVSGWTAITNPLDSTAGSLLEEDPDYRLRREEELSAAGACTLDSMRADILALPGVASVVVYENTEMVPDPSTGLPPKSFMAMVWDQGVGSRQDQSIGDVVWGDKPAGIQAYGSTAVQVLDSRDVVQTTYFSRPQVKNVYLAFTITLAPGAILRERRARQYKAAIVGLPALNPGDPVIALKYRAAALRVARRHGRTGPGPRLHREPYGDGKLSR